VAPIHTFCEENTGHNALQSDTTARLTIIIVSHRMQQSESSTLQVKRCRQMFPNGGLDKKQARKHTLIIHFGPAHIYKTE